MYIKNNNGNVVLYDVDDTLIMWERPNSYTDQDSLILVGDDGHFVAVWPNKKEIESLKAAKVRGHYVRVASQGGQDWAELVVKALGLENYVDSVECKPKWYHDDLPADTWMKRFWKNPNEGET